MTLNPISSGSGFIRNPFVLACSIALATAAGNVRADQNADMQAKLDALQKQVAELQAQMNAAAAKSQKQEESAAAPAVPVVRNKPGDSLTFQIGDKSEVTLY